MYMDHIKYEYITATNAPYLVQEVPRSTNLPAGYTFYLESDLKALFDRVRKSRPGWKLKVSPATAVVSNGAAVRHVTVWSGSDLLGKVWLETAYRGFNQVTAYAFTNERVDRSLARRRHKTTTKMELAAKEIIKHFYEETFDERMPKVAIKARSVVAESLNDAEHPSRMLQTTQFHRVLLQFAFDNWDAFAAANPTADMEIREKTRTYDAAQVARNRPILYLHQLANGEWTTGRSTTLSDSPSFGAATVADPRTVLTEDQFISLTMLRLQDTSRFVEGHGVRIDSTTFALVS